MRLLRKWVQALGDFAGAQDGTGQSEEQLALAALLLHVARVDGRVEASEEESLLALLSARFGLKPEAARGLVDRAGDLDREIDDIADLVAMLGHGWDDGRRRDLVGMAYRIAAADGNVGEFEEDLVWRLGQILGLGDATLTTLRDAQG